MFIPDTPINSKEKDQLGRAVFAQKLGETLRDWDRSESIVIALYGPWGSGKTSLLNLAINHVENTTSELENSKQPIIIKFNPWNFSDSQQLFANFFSELIIGIKSREPDAIEDLKTVVNRFANALSTFENLPVIGDAVSGPAKLISSLTSGDSLQTLKDKISEKFNALNRRVIIVLDDIDRLSESEIRLVFRLIKLNADFPNTIYLLSFARNIVEQALDTEQGISGRAYLEKIVQVGFDIPLADPAYLSQVLFDELNKILATLPEEYFDQSRWTNLYYAGFDKLFSSLRNIKRFINSLAFNLKIVSAREINLVDFIGIETLRVFMPEVYDSIAKNKALFTSSKGRATQKTSDPLREQLEQIFAKSRDLEIARNICQQLFPQIQGAYTNTWYGSESEEDWRKERRICSTDVFDTYFLLGIPKGGVGKWELIQIANLASDPTQLLIIFRSMREEGRIARLLDLISDIFANLTNNDEIFGLCRALLILGDELPNEQRGFADFGTDIRIARVIYNLLLRIGEPQRCEWLKRQIREDIALFTPIYLVSQVTPSEEAQNQKMLFDNVCLEELRAICVESIQRRVQNGQIENTKGFSYILFTWRKWGSDAKPLQDFIDQQSSSSDKFLNFVSEFTYVERSQVIGQNYIKEKWKLNVKALEDFIPSDTLKSQLTTIWPQITDIKVLPERQLSALKALVDAFMKPEDNAQRENE